MNHETPLSPEQAVPVWLWRGVLGLLLLVLVAGVGLAGALALGWRSRTPGMPDWTLGDLTWHWYGAEPLPSNSHTEGYRLQLSGPHQRAWAITERQFDEFELEVTVRSLLPSEDVGYGLIYRYQDPGNFYTFAVGGDGYYTIEVTREGISTALRPWQQWPHVRRGAAANRLRVHCQAATCRFYVNDEFTTEITAETTDDTFSGGSVGLWGQTFSDRALDVRFESVRLWSPN